MASLKTVMMRWPSQVTAASRNTTHILRRNTKPAYKLFLTTARPVHISAKTSASSIKTSSIVSMSRSFCTTKSAFNAKNPSSSDLATDAKAASEAAASLSRDSASASQGPPLDWNTFFTLRTRRRWIQMAFSALSTIAGITASAAILTTGMAEPLISQVPLDPFITLGLLVFACGGLGWLLGPSIGNQAFYLRNWRVKGQIQRKEAELFAKVKRHRVDPSNSSYGNPVPDFYGEKISSVSGYRQWLKDQRAFNRKKTKNMV